jgi:hypothetical protein
MIYNQEKRKFNRFERSFKVSISKVGKRHATGPEIHHVECINISASGILFSYAEYLKTGEELFLSFYPVEGTEEFVVEAKVVRSKKKDEHICLIAAHFTNFEKGDVETLNEVLHSM